MDGKSFAAALYAVVSQLDSDELAEVMRVSGWSRHSIRTLAEGHEPRASRAHALLSALGLHMTLGDQRDPLVKVRSSSRKRGS